MCLWSAKMAVLITWLFESSFAWLVFPFSQMAWHAFMEIFFCLSLILDACHWSHALIIGCQTGFTCWRQPFCIGHTIRPFARCWECCPLQIQCLRDARTQCHLPSTRNCHCIKVHALRTFSPIVSSLPRCHQVPETLNNVPIIGSGWDSLTGCFLCVGPCHWWLF